MALKRAVRLAYRFFLLITRSREFSIYSITKFNRTGAHEESPETVKRYRGKYINLHTLQPNVRQTDFTECRGARPRILDVWQTCARALTSRVIERTNFILDPVALVLLSTSARRARVNSPGAETPKKYLGRRRSPRYTLELSVKVVGVDSHLRSSSPPLLNLD